MTINTFHNPPVSDYDDTSSFFESETIPDQSLSVKDILTRFTRDSIPLPSVQSGDDDDIDLDIDFNDLTDLQTPISQSSKDEIMSYLQKSEANNAKQDNNVTPSDVNNVVE